MTPDIEQIRARLEALKTGWTSVAQWQQMSLDFRRHIIEDETALLAAIDELTAENSTLSKDLDVAVRLLGASGKHLRTCASEEDTGNYVPCDCGLDRLVKW